MRQAEAICVICMLSISFVQWPGHDIGGIPEIHGSGQEGA